jgi:hypothetical protein
MSIQGCLAKGREGQVCSEAFHRDTVAPWGKTDARDPRGGGGKEQAIHAALGRQTPSNCYFYVSHYLKKYDQTKRRAEMVLLSAEPHIVGNSVNICLIHTYQLCNSGTESNNF